MGFGNPIGWEEEEERSTRQTSSLSGIKNAKEAATVQRLHTNLGFLGALVIAQKLMFYDREYCNFNTKTGL